MILFFGPAGSAKGTQGQMLADSQGWNCLLMGQLLRDKNDNKLNKIIQEGKLVPDNAIYEIITIALKHISNIDNVIFDGFPRQLEQAHWLIQNKSLHGHSIDLVFVLDVPRDELIKRLILRGRVDDTPSAIDERLRIYKQDTYPILDYLKAQDVKIIHIDGVGTVDQVHDRIIKELISCKLV